jgi:hypothetical protein
MGVGSLVPSVSAIQSNHVAKIVPLGPNFPRSRAQRKPLTQISAVVAGELTPAEASEVGKLVDTYVLAVEVTGLSERLERLE